MDGWDFDMNERVAIGARRAPGAKEGGTVIGRAEYADAERAYYVAYRDGAGCYRKEWFNAEDLGTES